MGTPRPLAALVVCGGFAIACASTPSASHATVPPPFDPDACAAPPPRPAGIFRQPPAALRLRAVLVVRPSRAHDPRSLELTLTLATATAEPIELGLTAFAFSSAALELVDRTCARVPLAGPLSDRAIAYEAESPYRIAPGGPGTFSLPLAEIAPDLSLRPGVYAIRYAMHIPARPWFADASIVSPWAQFTVER